MFEAEGLTLASDEKYEPMVEVFNYSLCLRSRRRQTEKGWKGPVETQHPKTKKKYQNWTLPFGSIVARIADISVSKREFKEGGKQMEWVFTLLAGEKYAKLKTTYMSDFLYKFLMTAPNLDFSRSIFVKVFKGTNRKTQKDETAVWFKQGEGSNPDKWETVPTFWKAVKDEDGNFLKAESPTGDILPGWDHDEEDDTWDKKPQYKHLVKYFKEHVLPKITELYEHVDVSGMDCLIDIPEGEEVPENQADDTPEFSGGGDETHLGNVDSAQDDADDVFDTTPKAQEQPKGPPTKPSNPKAASVAEAMTTKQTVTLKDRLGSLGMDPEQSTQALLGIGFMEMSQEAARYMLYRVAEKEKAREAAEKAKAEQAQEADPFAEDDDDDMPF